MITTAIKKVYKAANSEWSIESELDSTEVSASYSNGAGGYSFEQHFGDLDSLKSFVEVANEYIKIVEADS